MCTDIIDSDEAYSNHLFEMASINVGYEDSVLLQQNGHNVFKEMWTQQHAGDFKKFLLVAERSEKWCS